MERSGVRQIGVSMETGKVSNERASSKVDAEPLARGVKNAHDGRVGGVQFSWRLPVRVRNILCSGNERRIIARAKGWGPGKKNN